MEALQWYCLGVISMMAVMGMVYFQMVVKPRWYAMPLLVLGLVLVLFGIAWGGSSLIEGYPRSSALGIFFFSGPGVLIIAVTWKQLIAPGFKLEQSE